jgi:hypothetical protein
MFIFCSEMVSACGEVDKIAARRVPGSRAQKSRGIQGHQGLTYLTWSFCDGYISKRPEEYPGDQLYLLIVMC